MENKPVSPTDCTHPGYCILNILKCTGLSLCKKFRIGTWVVPSLLLSTLSYYNSSFCPLSSNLFPWLVGNAQEDQHAGHQHHRQGRTQRCPLQRQRPWLPSAPLPEQLQRKIPVPVNQATTSKPSPLLRRPLGGEETVGTHGLPWTDA